LTENNKKIGRTEFKTRVLKEAEEQKILRQVSIEILDYCNYNCGYCYVHGSNNSSINLHQFKNIINQLADVGTLWVTLSGGKPLLHPDFISMYSYAIEKIPYVTLFTNASLISDKIINLFKEKPPYEIEISLYGIDDTSYDSFVKKTGQFELFQSNLDKLDKNGISYSLKTTITRQNVGLLPLFIQYANKRGVNYRYDSVVLPKIFDSSTKINSEYRLPSKDAVDALLSRKGMLKKAIDIYNGRSSTDNRLYRCDAGINSVAIDSKLKMSYCVAVREPYYSLNEDGKGIEAGHQWLMEMRNQSLDRSDKCFNCDKKALCRYCPGRFYLETGSEHIPPEWNCLYGQYLYKRIMMSKENNRGNL